MPQTTPETPENDYLFKLSDKLYDALKFTAKLIPLLMVFYTAIASAWGLPHAEAVLTSLGALTVLLNSIADQSTIGYYRKVNK